MRMSMKNWPVIKIAELVENKEADLQTGPFGTQLKASDYVDEGIPLINVRNIGYGEIRKDKIEFLNEKMANKLSMHILNKGDIVFGRKGAVDRHAFIDEKAEGWIQGSDCLRLRIRSGKVCNKYLSYYFNTSAHRYWMEAVCSFGATMSSLNQDIVKIINIPLPLIRDQEKIAAILSAYDDLIEKNKRRIALLEKMAEEIYREWFVRMRFPGHEKVKFKKKIPDGWKKVKLEKAFKFTGGGTPSKKDERYWADGSVNWFTPSDITSGGCLFFGRSGERCTDEGLSNSSARLFPAYSIMITSRATIGAIGINTIPACTNQGFITCIPNERYPLEFLYHWLKLSKPYFELLAGGAIFAELTKTTFKRIEILTPPTESVSLFADIVSPLLKIIEKLLQTNVNLVNKRDMLLPRLILGRLPVEKLEVQHPPSMQNEQDVDHAQLHLRR